MKWIFFKLGRLFQILFPKKFVQYFFSIRRHFNTGYYSKYLKYIGHNSTIDYPLRLIGGEGISLGNNVTIAKRAVITTWSTTEYFSPEIVFGNDVSVGEDCHITAINKIEIGNQVLLGKKITITDNSHGKNDSITELSLHPSKRKLYSKGPVIIHDRVWIGDKATILPGVTIGENSIIGANSVVTKNVPANSVCAGNPAKIIKIID
jgi:acetyltransferase-like isoleucine patch superfamily enzyme